MNLFSLTRFVMNVLIVGMISAFWITYIVAEDVSGGAWALAIFIVAALCGLGMTAIAIIRPKDAEIGHDELARQTNRDSYLFGYWVTLGVFLIMLAFVLTGYMAPQTAFYTIGTPLGMAPASFMIWGYLRGRAG